MTVTNIQAQLVTKRRMKIDVMRRLLDIAREDHDIQSCLLEELGIGGLPTQENIDELYVLLEEMYDDFTRAARKT